MGKGIFFTSAAILLTVILATTLRSRYHHHHHHDESQYPPFDLGSHASNSLRSNGFVSVAKTLLAPDLYLKSPESTIFAIPDLVLNNLSNHNYSTNELLFYHISPSKLTFQDLFNKPINTCFPTLFQQLKIAITKRDDRKRVLEINNVLITHPDLFVQGPVSIHGVAGSFAYFDHHQEITQLPICELNHNDVVHSSSIGLKVDFTKNRAEWGKVVKFLSSSGFVPFAIGLNSVIDGILKDHPDLDSVTIFAPPHVALMAMPSPLLDIFMRFHIIPQRQSFKQLASLPDGASLTALAPHKDVVITKAINLPQILSVNGVEITSPDLFSSKSFVVHGMARAFVIEELSTASI